MKRYVVSFREVRSYEMTIEAPNEQLAVCWAKRGPEFPVWVGAELEDYQANEIEGDAP